MDEVIAEMFKGFDANLVTEDTKIKVVEMINSIVNEKVKAKTDELDAKTKELSEKEEKLVKDIEEKEKILQEEAAAFAVTLAEQFKEKEEIILEAVREYKEVTEAEVITAAKELKELFENIALEEVTNARNHYENIFEETAKEYREKQDATLAEQVSAFKEDMTSKLDEYLEVKLKESIPSELYEAASQLAAYKPLVEGITRVMESHNVKIDATGREALDHARTQVKNLTESVNTKTKENVKLVSKVKELEKAVKIATLTEGMTVPQKKKIETLLESVSVDEVEAKFKQIRDSVITESVKPARVDVKSVDNQGVPVVNKQLQKLTEGKEPAGSSEIQAFAHTLNKMRRA